jgi:ppGpp synthetase/RelA/SpoT-type nucleotidyltranferase
MSATTREAARMRYIRERPMYVEAADYADGELRKAAARAQLSCNATSRAKDVSSFVKKAITKALEDPWKAITDKVGVRVVVRHSGDLDRAHEMVSRTFREVWTVDDRAGDVQEDRLRYPRLHIQVELPSGVAGNPEPLQCEVQIRTEAADLWSRMSHAFLYKPETELPRTVRRSLYGLLALVEIHDREVERAVAAMTDHPDYDLNLLIGQAERVFYTFCTHDYNMDLSRRIVATILKAVDPPQRPQYGRDLAGFADLHRATLGKIYRTYGPHSEPGMKGSFILVGQPESVALFERLENAPLLLEALWEEAGLPDDWLSELRAIWG